MAYLIERQANYIREIESILPHHNKTGSSYVTKNLCNKRKLLFSYISLPYFHICDENLLNKYCVRSIMYLNIREDVKNKYCFRSIMYLKIRGMWKLWWLFFDIVLLYLGLKRAGSIRTMKRSFIRGDSNL